MKRFMGVAAAIVLAVGMMAAGAGAALADSEGAGTHGTTNPSEWTTIGSMHGSGSGVLSENMNAWPAQGPVETGAVPDRVSRSDSRRWLNMDVVAQNENPNLRGLENIQEGP